ncbi:MAG: HNH endonuclease signature motif containing protein [Patescibacteria group bacterium]
MLCIECAACGRDRAATVVDHKEPHKGDYELFWDEDNWQGLCASCHNRKTAAEDGGLGNQQGVKIRGDCGIDGVPRDEKHWWNQGKVKG